MKQVAAAVVIAFLYVSSSQGQTLSSPVPTEHGMYVSESGELRKIIGQIAEFKRSGSRLANDLTIGIKTRKVNIQLLGPTAQTVVSPQPVFYFVPAKQEQAVGVNAGDLILVRLEEKPNRRQFEIAASGAWRDSAGITLTHQVQLLREEVEPDIYKVMPATELRRGEYALFLARGEGMAPYVYDFSVQPIRAIRATEEIRKPTLAAARVTDEPDPKPTDPKPLSSAVPEGSGQATIGMFAEGNVNVRHDGITVTAITPGGPADQAGIKAGDDILAINNHYIFTIAEMRAEIAQLVPSTKIIVRYRRHSAILDVPVVPATIQ